MALKFTKLTVGDAVVTSGTRAFKKLSAGTEHETVDVAQLVGTWTLLEENLDCSMLVVEEIYNLTFTYGSYTTKYVAIKHILGSNNGSDYITIYNSSMSGSNLYYDNHFSTRSTNANIWHVTEVTETDPVKLLAIKQFLETNGTKQ